MSQTEYHVSGDDEAVLRRAFNSLTPNLKNAVCSIIFELAAKDRTIERLIEALKERWDE